MCAARFRGRLVALLPCASAVLAGDGVKKASPPSYGEIVQAHHDKVTSMANQNHQYWNTAFELQRQYLGDVLAHDKDKKDEAELFGSPSAGQDWFHQASFNNQEFPMNAIVYTYSQPWNYDDALAVNDIFEEDFLMEDDNPVLWIQDLAEDGPLALDNLRGTLWAIKRFERDHNGRDLRGHGGRDLRRPGMIIVGTQSRWPETIQPQASLLDVMHALTVDSGGGRITQHAVDHARQEPSDVAFLSSDKVASSEDLSKYRLAYKPTIYAFDSDVLPKWNGFFKCEI